MKQIACPRCQHEDVTKSGIVKGRQRYRCRSCAYSFTVLKDGKNIDPYYVIKALQMYMEGISLREIERILGMSHVTVMNWVKKHNIKAPENHDYRPTYKVLDHIELQAFFKDREAMRNSGCMVTELGDKFMVIKWERFKR